MWRECQESTCLNVVGKLDFKVFEGGGNVTVQCHLSTFYQTDVSTWKCHVARAIVQCGHNVDVL